MVAPDVLILDEIVEYLCHSNKKQIEILFQAHTKIKIQIDTLK